MNYDNVIKNLIEGNERFLQDRSLVDSKSSLKKLKDFAKNGQLPKAIVLCCSDSRAPVEMIFDQDVGDLFVIRVAGNIVAPSLVGSIEFAASTFGTDLVLVMGHTSCGAIKATLDHIENTLTIDSENIHDLISRIKPNIFMLSQRSDISYEDKLNKAVELNVISSVAQLSHSSRLIEGLVSENKLKIIGAVFELGTGKVNFLDV